MAGRAGFHGGSARCLGGDPGEHRYYGVLRAVDYFRSASLFDGEEPDERITDAAEAVRAARQPDGTWLQERRHPGRVWFEVDVPVGEPSKWLTYYGTRALDWWDNGQASVIPQV
ncbi:MAG: hypothetical protein ACKVOG_00480 [Rhodoglobus sp.]